MIRLSGLRYAFDNGVVAEDRDATLAELMRPEAWPRGRHAVGDFGIIAGSDGFTMVRVTGLDHEKRPILETAQTCKCAPKAARKE